MSKKKETAAELFRRIEDAHADKYIGKHIYRGANREFSKFEYGTSSGLYRLARNNNEPYEKYLPQFIAVTYAEIASINISSDVSMSKNLMTSQLTGGTTPLIDFSHSIYVALFYTSYEESGINDQEDGELLLLRPKNIATRISYDAPLPKNQISEVPRTEENKDLANSQSSLFSFPADGYIEKESYHIENIPKHLKKEILSRLEKFHNIKASTIQCVYGDDGQDEENFKDSHIYFSQGFTKQSQGKFQEATINYDNAIKLNPKLEIAYNNRGVVMINLKNYEEAIDNFDKAIELNTENALTYSNRGLVHGVLGKHEKAIIDFGKAIELNPKYVGAYINRGYAKSKLKLYKEAIKDNSIAIKLDSQDSAAYNNRGTIWHALEKFDKAIIDYDKAIAINPNYSDAYNNRGNIWLVLEKFEKAIKDFDKVIAINPTHSETYNNRGIAKSKLNKHDEAIKDCSIAIKLDSQYTAAYYNRGNIWRALEKFDKAIIDYDKAIEISPNLAIAYHCRGLAKNHLGDKEGAKADFKNAKDLGSKRPIPT